ncbi:unnamed protein product, partial [Porites evermanni]
MVYLTVAIIGLGRQDEIKRELNRLHSASLHTDVQSHRSAPCNSATGCKRSQDRTVMDNNVSDMIMVKQWYGVMLKAYLTKHGEAGQGDYSKPKQPGGYYMAARGYDFYL